MNSDEFETKMRRLESYHDLRVPDGSFIILRIDGRSFTSLTEKTEHPFDLRMHELMVAVTTEVVRSFSAVYGYTESDEISILLPKNFDLFDRSVEKVVSISASIAASVFVQTENAMINTGEIPPDLFTKPYPHFDSRIIVAPQIYQVVDYFRWRQSDCQRCCLNGYSYWKLREKGASKRQATKQLAGKKAAFKHELMHEHGLNFAKLPGWQKDGTGMWWEFRNAEGYNPKTQETVQTVRRDIRVSQHLPTGDRYGKFIEEIASGTQLAEIVNAYLCEDLAVS